MTDDNLEQLIQRLEALGLALYRTDYGGFGIPADVRNHTLAEIERIEDLAKTAQPSGTGLSAPLLQLVIAQFISDYRRRLVH